MRKDTFLIRSARSQARLQMQDANMFRMRAARLTSEAEHCIEMAKACEVHSLRWSSEAAEIEKEKRNGLARHRELG